MERIRKTLGLIGSSHSSGPTFLDTDPLAAVAVVAVVAVVVVVELNIF